MAFLSILTRAAGPELGILRPSPWMYPFFDLSESMINFLASRLILFLHSLYQHPLVFPRRIEDFPTFPAGNQHHATTQSPPLSHLPKGQRPLQGVLPQKKTRGRLDLRAFITPVIRGTPPQSAGRQGYPGPPHWSRTMQIASGKCFSPLRTDGTHSAYEISRFRWLWSPRETSIAFSSAKAGPLSSGRLAAPAPVWRAALQSTPHAAGALRSKSSVHWS